MSEIRVEIDLPHPPAEPPSATHDADNQPPAAAPPQPDQEPAASNMDDPSDPWALSDPLVTAGVAVPLPDEAPRLEPPPRPDLAESPARRTPAHRLVSAFPSRERLRAAAITVTAALVVVTLGWLWLTRQNHEDAPSRRYPQGTDGAVAGEQPKPVLPSGAAPSAGFSAGPLPSSAASVAPVVTVPSGGTAPQSSASPPPAVSANQPLTASYAAQGSKGLLGYKVKVTVSVDNPDSQANSTWTVVLTVPSGADLQGSSPTVDARKDGGEVTITPKDGAIAGGATVVFDVTFGGAALLGIGSGGVTGCTVDGAACTRA